MKVSHSKRFSRLKIILIILFVMIIIGRFTLTTAQIEGESMLPTFFTGDKVFISKFSLIDRFDIIVFNSPIESHVHIKRVIGMPGDEVQVKNDVLYVNGKKYKETYLNEHSTEDLKVTVPEGKLYVMGDNRRESNDSRLYGFISKEAVIGEVKLKYSPLNQLSIFN
ncbi:signal peptidase I [Rossellomorea vietnamensis]|uniref:Signal peptidase I n=1 Tax=Rossellomorea vietnamensis TaxID=218284 RepID=A0ACD4CCV4_9BACI|nr:signal peptidase I [Rossellomorea vietnamensis]UXH46423.1 signal peptidase I [Rossellomorea vietnamensis]